MKLTVDFHLMLNLKMRRAISPLSYAFYGVMFIKHRDKFTSLLYDVSFGYVRTRKLLCVLSVDPTHRLLC
jgi:hypothetical protein